MEVAQIPQVLQISGDIHLLACQGCMAPFLLLFGWSCRNNTSGGELGIVEWYTGWRRYCYWPVGREVYSAGCLGDIMDFIDQLMEQRRDTRQGAQS